MNRPKFYEDRPATHAGTWYNTDSEKLRIELTTWLNQANAASSQGIPHSRIIVSPHAGYVHSGAVAAECFSALDTSNIRRVFILGPNHTQEILRGCAVSSFKSYQTPLGDLAVDQKTALRLVDSGAFTSVHPSMDLREHSLEMQAPILAALFISRQLPLPQIVPVVVGSLSHPKVPECIVQLAKELEDKQTAFIISSDFCHWGERFDYHYLPANCQPTLTINEKVKALDSEAMDAIRSLNPDTFKKHLSDTSNTICGRNPIIIMMEIAQKLMEKDYSCKLDWLMYKHSNQLTKKDQSFVAYAAGYMTLNNKD